MRTFILAVTGFVLSVAACSSYGTSVVEVNKTRAAVASVAVSIPRSIVAGQTARAVATVKDANGITLPDRTLTWYTSSAAIASVTDSGMVSAVAPGAAVVSAVSEGISGQATLAVISPPPSPAPVATVLVAISPASVVVGQKAHATATLEDASGNVLSGRTVTWQSSQPSIASVASTGDVTAVAAGTATITGSSEGQSGLASLTVDVPAPVPVASVAVSPATSTLQVGGTVQLTAVTRDASNNVLTGRTVVWSSANASIATVTALGFVTAIASGSVQVSASSEGQTAASAITVSAPAPPPAPVATVSVSPSSATLQIGGKVQLAAVTRDASNNVLTGRVITWTSSNISLATVSGSGLVTAVAAGPVQITATSEGKTASSTITVSAPVPPPPPAPVATVSVSPASTSVQVGSTVQLSAVTRDANNNILTGRVITWTSGNTILGTVSSSALFTAVAVGTVTVTATSEGITGTSSITVTAPLPPPPPGTGWRGHEPSGMTQISDEPFTSLPSNGWTGYRSWGIVPDATAPESPSSVFEITYPAGYASGDTPGLAELAVNPSYKELYVSMYMKYSPNFQGERTGTNKIIHFLSGPSTRNYAFIAGHGYGNGPLTARINLQGISAGGNYDNGTTGLYDSPIDLRGGWHLLEVIAISNTGSNLDGSVSLYVDGVLATSCTGIRFEAGSPLWNFVQESPTWGGGGDIATASMSIRIDHIYVSGK